MNIWVILFIVLIFGVGAGGYHGYYPAGYGYGGGGLLILVLLILLATGRI